MIPIFIQLAKETDRAQIFEWAASTSENYFDPEVLKYPTTIMLKATKAGVPVVYMPVQSPIVMESLAVNPSASDHEVSVALKEMVVSLRLLAQQRGIGEIYFLGTNDRTNKFASNYGFVELPWRVYRMKVQDEDSYGNNQAAPVGQSDGGLQGREQDFQAATTTSLRRGQSAS